MACARSSTASTRHHVLGLEAVLADGERDPHGWEVRQVVDRVRPDPTSRRVRGDARARHGDHPQARPAARAPRDAAGAVHDSRDGHRSRAPHRLERGTGPFDARVRRPAHHGRHHGAAGLDLGIPEEIQNAAAAYLVVVLESSSSERLDEDAEVVATLLDSLGATEVYVLPPTAGEQLIKARRTRILRRQGGRLERHRRRRHPPRRDRPIPRPRRRARGQSTPRS